MTRTDKITIVVIAITLVALAIMLLPGTAAADEGDNSLASALTSGDAGVALRYRYEHVDQANISDKANASTLRLRLNYRTGDWRGWSAFGEFDHVFHVLLTDFNSGGGTSPGKSQYPVVADPKGSDLNQLYVDHKYSDEWKFRFGRQRILLDNQRFVGGVGWRQNEQTFDALNLVTKAIPKTELIYSYVAWVRRIFGEQVPAGKQRINSHLFNAKVTINDAWSVVPYLYYLDYQAASSAANSTATFGARATGSIKAGDGKVAFVGELASQSDAADNPVNYSATYLHASALWSMPNNLSLGLAFESLGGDANQAGSAFRTPLATLHAFQGWADRFLTTPDAGINDVFVTAKYKTGAWNWTGVYHDFSADSGSGDYGTEFDIAVGRRFSERYGVLFKGAFFNGESGSGFPNTTKFWIQLTASY